MIVTRGKMEKRAHFSLLILLSMSAALVFVGVCSGCSGLGSTLDGITHGPILGRPSARSMTIWARTSGTFEFQVHYGLKPNNLDQHSTSSRALIEHDNTALCTLEGLQPDTRYFYRISTQHRANADPNKLSGSFRTLPSSELLKDAQEGLEDVEV